MADTDAFLNKEILMKFIGIIFEKDFKKQEHIPKIVSETFRSPWRRLIRSNERPENRNYRKFETKQKSSEL